MNRSRAIAAAYFIVQLAVTAWGADERLQVGAMLEPFTVEDQHGKQQAIDDSVRLIVFAADMDAGELAKQALAENGRALLAGAGAVYFADISGMPRMIATMMAVPAMRKRDYPVLLDRSGALTRRFPRAKAQLTVLTLERLRVQDIRQVASAAELRQVLAPASP